MWILTPALCIVTNSYTFSMGTGTTTDSFYLIMGLSAALYKLDTGWQQVQVALFNKRQLGHLESKELERDD